MEKTGKKPTSDYRIIPSKSAMFFIVDRFDHLSRQWVPQIGLSFYTVEEAKAFIDSDIEEREALRKHRTKKTIYYP